MTEFLQIHIEKLLSELFCSWEYNQTNRRPLGSEGQDIEIQPGFSHDYTGSRCRFVNNGDRYVDNIAAAFLSEPDTIPHYTITNSLSLLLPSSPGFDSLVKHPGSPQGGDGCQVCASNQQEA